MAETYLNRTVQDTVITVPPHFHEAQRLATKKAAVMAGLNVIRIVNASMAAGVAYGIDTLIIRPHHADTRATHGGLSSRFSHIIG
jgi:molecular chaperone DnaK (HSP70)